MITFLVWVDCLLTWTRDENWNKGIRKWDHVKISLAMTNISIYSPLWAASCLEYATVTLAPEIISFCMQEFCVKFYFGRQSFDSCSTVLKFGIRSRLSCDAKPLSVSPWYFSCLDCVSQIKQNMRYGLCTDDGYAFFTYPLTPGGWNCVVLMTVGDRGGV